MIEATSTCHEQSTEKKGKAMTQKKGERKIKSNYHFHTLNKHNGIEALSEFRCGFFLLNHQV